MSLYAPAGSDNNQCYLEADSKFQLDYPFTVEAWIWLDTQGSVLQTVISAAEGGPMNYQLQITTTGKVGFVVRVGGSSFEVISTSDVLIKKWVYVAGSYDGVTLSVHNHLEQDTVAQAGHVYLDDAELGLGVLSGHSSYLFPLQGYLGGAHIMKRIKTQSEIEKYLIGV